MTAAPLSGFFLLLAAEKKTPKNRAALMSLRSFLFCDDFSAMSGIYLVSVDRYQAIFHPLERQITRAQKHVQNS